MGDKSVIAQRFLDAGEEPTKTLIPLEGYENKDLVSLEEAVKSINVPIHNLSAMVWTAKRNARNPSDGLTSDESASIFLYTLEWPEGYDGLYKLLNQKLRSENRKCLTSWFSYLKLFLTALYKLPSTKATVWRGIRDDVSHLYKDDFIWWGFSSCTTEIEVIEEFLGQSGVRTIFTIECINGKVIRSHSSYQAENEILLMPGTYLRVKGKSNPAKDLYMIHLQEENPPYQLLKPPFNLLTASGDIPSFNKLIISELNLPKSQAASTSFHENGDVIDVREREILELRSRLNELMVSYDETVSNKSSLEFEINTYRRLLESEEKHVTKVKDTSSIIKQTDISLSTSIRHNEYTPPPPTKIITIQDTKINQTEMQPKTTFTRSARGSIYIDECSPDGKYIQLANTSKNKDIDLTGWRLLRKVDNSPEITYLLPSNFKLASGKYLKIHGKGQAEERPPYDLVLPTHDSWGVGLSVVTRLFDEQNDEKATHIQKTIYVN